MNITDGSARVYFICALPSHSNSLAGKPKGLLSRQPHSDLPFASALSTTIPLWSHSKYSRLAEWADILDAARQHRNSCPRNESDPAPYIHYTMPRSKVIGHSIGPFEMLAPCGGRKLNRRPRLLAVSGAGTLGYKW